MKTGYKTISVVLAAIVLAFSLYTVYTLYGPSDPGPRSISLWESPKNESQKVDAITSAAPMIPRPYGGTPGNPRMRRHPRGDSLNAGIRPEVQTVAAKTR